MLKGTLVFKLVLGGKPGGQVRLVDTRPEIIQTFSNPSPSGRFLEAFGKSRAGLGAGKSQEFLAADWTPDPVDHLRGAREVFRRLAHPAQRQQAATLGRVTILED